MDQHDDFAQAVFADLQARVPGLKDLGQRSRDIVLRAGRRIAAVSFRALAGASKPEDPAVASESDQSLDNIKVAGVIRFSDEFKQSAANVLKQGWDMLKKVVPFPLP